MDEFMVYFWKKKNQNTLLTWNSIYEKIQKKNLDTIGLLRKLCHAFKQANKDGKTSIYSMEDTLNLVKQTVIF